MSLELISIGNELLALSEMFLSAAPLAVSTSQTAIARAWRVNATNVLLLVANSAPSTATIILKIQSSLSGTARVLYESGVSPRTLSGGVLDDSLSGFSVRIYSIDLSTSDGTFLFSKSCSSPLCALHLHDLELVLDK